MAESSEVPGDMPSSLTSLDDFTHLSVDKYMSSSVTKSQFSQVIFRDLCDIYPTDSDIKCSYSLTDNVKPQAGDKIAIFKIGWLSVSDCITFVRAQVPENGEGSALEVTFKAGTFPKKDNELYQLCYVTSENVIAGASTSFCFRKPQESEFLAVEDPADADLVVFRSRVAQLQSDLDQENQQKKALEAKYDLNDKFNILKKEFDKCENELIAAKEENTQLLKKQEELITEKDEVHKNLEKTKNDLDLMRHYCGSIEYELEILKNKHEQVIMQNQKQVMVNLKEKPQAAEAYQNLKAEVDQKQKLAEDLKEDKQILEDKIREQNIANDNLISEIGNLKCKLRELSEKHNVAMAESHILGDQLKEAEAVIENMKKDIAEQHKVMTNNPEGSQYLKCKEERDLYGAQFENLLMHHLKCNEKLHMRTTELTMKPEGEKAAWMTKETILQNRITELENTLQSASGGGRSSAPFKDTASQLFDVFSGACSHVQNVFEGKLNSKSNQQQSDVSGDQNYDLEKQELREKIKYLKQQKAELSENIVQEKRRISELEKILTETKEENAALKSRINVLEYELVMFKSTADAVSNTPSPAHPVSTGQLDSLNKSLPITKEFNDIVDEQKLLEEKLQEEKAANIILQSKVEFLLQEDAKINNKLLDITFKYEQLMKEKEFLIINSNACMEQLQRVLEDNDTTISGLKAKLLESINERERMHKTINELRKELIWKYGVETSHKTKEQELRSQLAAGDKQILEDKMKVQNIANDNLILEIGNLKFKLRELSEKHKVAMAESHILGDKLKETAAEIENMKKDIAEQHKVMTNNPEGGQNLKCKEERDLYGAQFANPLMHHLKYDEKLHMRTTGIKRKHEDEKAAWMTKKTKLQNRITELENTLQSALGGGRSSAPAEDPTSKVFQVSGEVCSHWPNVINKELNSMFNQLQTDVSAEQNYDLEKHQLLEKIKYLQQQKAELSENIVQEKHRISELEKILGETEVENAALKSRINVLEYELAMFKSPAGAVSNTPSPAHSVFTEQLDSLNKSLPIIKEFNDIVAEQKLLEEKLQEEKTAKII